MLNIYDYCYKNWKYVNDPNGTREYVAKASESMKNNKIGDCDDFAVLIATMITAVSGHASVNYAFSSTDGHAFTEVCLGKSPDMYSIKEYISTRYDTPDATIHFRKDESERYWLNMDWMGYGVQRPGAEYYKFERGSSYYILEQTQIGFSPSESIHTDAEVIKNALF